ncbi:MAG TPA: hypothetical protein EYH26_00155 [Pyrodictium sp.]|nr:hypothetical protein [Pyrodictium sp.]
MRYQIHSNIDASALSLTSPYIPICVAGDLRYGGKLHYVVAGTIYAGGIPARLVMGKCKDYLLPLRYGEGEYQFVEIYYVESWRLKEIIKHLTQVLGIDIKRQTLRLEGGECIIYCEAFVVNNETCNTRIRENEQRKWARILLAMPPHATIIVPPLAVYPLTLDNVKPCADGHAYCVAPGSSFVVGVHDIYVNMDRLYEVFSNNIELEILPAKDSFNRLYCVYTPIERKEL